MALNIIRRDSENTLNEIHYNISENTGTLHFSFVYRHCATQTGHGQTDAQENT